MKQTRKLLLHVVKQLRRRRRLMRKRRSIRRSEGYLIRRPPMCCVPGSDPSNTGVHLPPFYSSPTPGRGQREKDHRKVILSLASHAVLSDLESIKHGNVVTLRVTSKRLLHSISLCLLVLRRRKRRRRKKVSHIHSIPTHQRDHKGVLEAQGAGDSQHWV